MRILSPRIHGVLDLVVVAVLVLGPIVLGLGGSPAAIAYSLAAIHLLMTLITDFPMGVWKKIPFFVHGIVELIVGVALLVLPSYAGYGPGSPARRFYLAMGAVILVVWALTAYRGGEQRTA
jgi:peptidoglycan/LPS O-acetylase OafA/YrhL